MESLQRSLAGDYAAEVLFFFFKVGDALLEPTLRIYIYEAVCLNNYQTDEICEHLENYPDQELVVQSITSRFMMYYKFLINCPAMLIVLFCGAWSDESGRKLPVMLTSIGTFSAVLLYTIAGGYFGSIPYVPMIFIGAGVRGIFGRSAVMTMAAHSYVSDYTAPEQRTARLSGLVATSHFGYLLGSILAGVCMEKIGFVMIFLIVMVLHTVIIILACCCMRDETAGERTPVRGNNRNSIEENYSEDTNNFRFQSDERSSLTSSIKSREDLERRSIKFAPTGLESPDSKSLEDRNISTGSGEDTRLGTGAQDSRHKSPESPTQDSIQDDEITVLVTEEQYEEDKDQPNKPTNEVRNDDADDDSDEESESFFRHHLSSFSVCTRPRKGASCYIVFTLFFIIYLQQANKSGETDVLLLFSKRSPLNLSKAGYGYLLASVYASLGFFALVVPRILSRAQISIRDTTLAMIGSTFKIISLVLLAVSKEPSLLFLAYTLSGPHSLTISSVKSMISKLCHEKDLGKAFSLLSSGETLANLMGTIFYTNIYAATLTIFPCVPFLIEMGLYCAIFILLLQISILMNRRHHEKSNPECESTGSRSTYGSIEGSNRCHKAVSVYHSP